MYIGDEDTIFDILILCTYFGLLLSFHQCQKLVRFFVLTIGRSDQAGKLERSIVLNVYHAVGAVPSIADLPSLLAYPQVKARVPSPMIES